MQELNLAEVAQIAGGLYHLIDDSQSEIARDLKPHNI